MGTGEGGVIQLEKGRGGDGIRQKDKGKKGGWNTENK